jgi:uroporphyrinogen-III decarboxylase
MWLVDEETGESKSLLPPTPGGTNTACASPRHSALDTLPNTQDDIDVLVPLPEEFNRERFLAEGRQDAARAIEESTSLFLYAQIASPLWRLYKVLGYEGMMILLAENPQLASYAAERISAETIQLIRQIAALGVKAAWIEECLTDQISPALYRRINIPLLRRCVEEIKAHGMLSIYYYCGNPNDRFEDILDSGADALHLEESKKGFQINIEDIAERVKGRCVLFGNLDTIGVLQNGSEETLRFEINRQLNAGRKCGGRFIMSTGSPIPPETPVERVRLYTDLARELGKPS